MRRSTAALLLFFLTFLQGWELWDRAYGHDHELCEHGEWVHTATSSDGHPNSKSSAGHDHCNLTGAFAHAMTLGTVPSASQLMTYSQEVGVPPFFTHVSTILLSEAPKTSPPA